MLTKNLLKLTLSLFLMVAYNINGWSQIEGTSQPGSLNIGGSQKIEGYSQQGSLQIRQNTPKAGQISGMSSIGTLHIGQQAKNKNQGNVSAVQVPALSTPNAETDVNIPETNQKRHKTFALIIGNEDYHSHQMGLGAEVDVKYAVNDARVFKEYCTKTLGIPDKNITLLTNARAVEIHRALKKMNLLAKNAGKSGELIFYYAGHGLPDEQTKIPYLIPVDVSASDLQFAVSLPDLYDKLTEFPVKKVTVFLDACFSGGAREQGLVAARGVKVKPKETAMQGKLIVFSASSGEQSALPYDEKKHGMFTYHLLKKMQETKGKLYYGDLGKYLKNEVSINSLLINEKEQNPQINVSPGIEKDWKNWKF